MSKSISKTLVQPGAGALAMLEVPATITRAVLLAPPLFEERKSTLSMLSALSRKLAQGGALVARCDIPGTGHAEGDIEDLTSAAWQGALRATANFLRAQAPGVPLFLVGVRISAAWVAQLAREIPDVAGVVFIAPVSGFRFLRQLAQRSAVNQMMIYGKPQLLPNKVEEAIRAGRTLDFDGYAITPALYDALRAVVITPAACQSLCIATQHDGPDAAACNAGKTVSLTLPVFWNTVGFVDPAPILNAVAEWFARQPAASTQPIDHPSHSSYFSVASALGALHGFRYAPSGTPAASILFLHGWSGDGTGPHRMFVKLSRRLVASGHLCHAFDFGGRGESEGEHAAASIATMTADARAVLEHMQRAAPNAPLVVVAICSGSKVALSLAAEGAPVQLVLLSAEPLGALRDSRRVARRKLCHAMKTYFFKLFQRQTWKKLLSGKVQSKGVRSALVSTEKPSDAEVRHETALLKKLCDYTGRILFLFAERDPEAAPSAAAYSTFCTENKIPFQLHTLPNTGHSYYNLDAEAEVIKRVAEFVEQIKN